jgi:hypothetical protein
VAEIEENSTGWIKSSRSAQGNCVEVRVTDRVQIRDSKDRGGPVISVSREAWQVFLDAVADGEFDQS